MSAAIGTVNYNQGQSDEHTHTHTHAFYTYHRCHVFHTEKIMFTMPYKQPSEKAVEMIRFGIICQIYEPHKCRSTLEVHFEEHFPLYL